MPSGNRVTFQDPEDMTPPSEDGQSLRFRFTIVPAEAAGTPLERSATTEHELIVRLTGRLSKAWGLDAQRGRAVMVHAAVQRVVDVVRDREFRPSEELVIDTETFPGSLPSHFDRPMSVGGSMLVIERAASPVDRD